MAEAYRFNGPVPEAVKQLRDRRAYRGSQLYQTIKRGRRMDAEAKRGCSICFLEASQPIRLSTIPQSTQEPLMTNSISNPGERVIPAMDNKQLMELLSKSEKELLVLILLELRQFIARSENGTALKVASISPA